MVDQIMYKIQFGNWSIFVVSSTCRQLPIYVDYVPEHIAVAVMVLSMANVVVCFLFKKTMNKTVCPATMSDG